MVATAPGSCESLFLPPRDVLALRAAAEGSKKTPPINYAVTDGRRGRPELPLNQKRANGVGTLSRLSRSIAFLLSRVRSRLGGFPAAMQDACRYSDRPLAFLARYVRRRPVAHAAILIAVVAAVACSVGAQYGVKVLVDTLAGGLYVGTHARDAWLGFLLLATLIAADNLLWRVASWIASSTFVAVTGDLRRDLFRHLTGHAPSYFADRMPGTLTSRITATSNAVFTLQNMSVWNVLPPCMATVVAIAFVVTVSVPMAAALTGSVASIAGSTPPLTGKWRRVAAAFCIWKNCACSTPR